MQKHDKRKRKGLFGRRGRLGSTGLLTSNHLVPYIPINHPLWFQRLKYSQKLGEMKMGGGIGAFCFDRPLFHALTSSVSEEKTRKGDEKQRETVDGGKWELQIIFVGVQIIPVVCLAVDQISRVGAHEKLLSLTFISLCCGEKLITPQWWQKEADVGNEELMTFGRFTCSCALMHHEQCWRSH